MRRRKIVVLGVCVFAVCLIGNVVLQDLTLWLRALLVSAAAGIVAWLVIRFPRFREHP